MSACWEREGPPGRTHVFLILALILVFVLVIGSKALASTLVNASISMEAGKLTPNAKRDDDSSVDHAGVAVVPQLVLQASPVDGSVTWTTSRTLREVGKQAIDQPGHFLIGAAPIWASRCLVGLPWLGWVAAPIIAYREWLQWPSNRWWDPPLDWGFFTLGAVAATWSRRPGQRLAAGLAAIRESLAWRSAVHGRMRPAG